MSRREWERWRKEENCNCSVNNLNRNCNVTYHYRNLEMNFSSHSVLLITHCLGTYYVVYKILKSIDILWTMTICFSYFNSFIFISFDRFWCCCFVEMRDRRCHIKYGHIDWSIQDQCLVFWMGMYVPLKIISFWIVELKLKLFWLDSDFKLPFYIPLTLSHC